MTTTYDVIEKSALEQAQFDLSSRLESLHCCFKSSVVPENGLYTLLENTAVADTVRDMYRGVEVDGRQSLGLKEISEWKINPEYMEQNLRQHAGYAAEVISTSIENMNAARDGTGVITKRVDDLSAAERESFGGRFDACNDQYADKVRIKPDGSFETVQTKFVGHDAKSCLEKLTSKKYDKYIESGKVDKLEIPKDYYDEVKTRLYEKTDSLRDQYDRLRADGKTAEAEKVAQRIEKNNKLESMLEPSVIDSKTPVEALKNPKEFSSKQIYEIEAENDTSESVVEGAIVSGMIEAEIDSTATEIAYVTFDKLLSDIDIDSVKDFGIDFVKDGMFEATSKKITGSATPGKIASAVYDLSDDVIDYRNGKISGKKLAYNVGEKVFVTAGEIGGGALGGFVGTIVNPGAGTVVGGFIGEEIGERAAKYAYEKGAEFISENKETFIEIGENIADTSVEIAGEVVDIASDVKDNVSDVLDTVGDKAGDLKDAAAEKASELKDSASEALDSAGDKLSDLAGSVKNGVTSWFD